MQLGPSTGRPAEEEKTDPRSLKRPREDGSEALHSNSLVSQGTTLPTPGASAPHATQSPTAPPERKKVRALGCWCRRCYTI